MAEGQMKVTTLLKEYNGWVNDGAIQFLQEPEQQNEVSTCIRKLSRIMKRLEGGEEERVLNRLLLVSIDNDYCLVV